MTQSVRLWRSDDVARELGISLAKFRKTVRALQAEHGFPLMLPRLRRYDPVAIANWLARQRRAEAPIADTASPTDAELFTWQAVLDARADRLARPVPQR